MSPAGLVAVIAGWVTTEVGRQPYTVYGHLLTSESLSPLAAPAVATSLVFFAVVYFARFWRRHRLPVADDAPAPFRERT